MLEPGDEFDMVRLREEIEGHDFGERISRSDHLSGVPGKRTRITRHPGDGLRTEVRNRSNRLLGARTRRIENKVIEALPPKALGDLRRRPRLEPSLPPSFRERQPQEIKRRSFPFGNDEFARP